jgi:hypothetical protein
MIDDVRKKTLVVVHSVKGGCGKTTIAMALAQYFGLTAPGKTCYIDTDLVGVGTAVLAGDEGVEPGRSISDFVLLNPFDNPIFFKTVFEDTDQKLFDRFIYDPDAQSGRHFSAVFSSIQKKVVERAIRATNDFFFAEDVKSKIEILLSKLFEKDIDTVILDTTPGLQGITSIILELSEEITKKKYKHPDDGILYRVQEILYGVQVVYLVLSTINFAHLRGLWEYLYSKKKLFFEDKNRHFNYLLVLNQIPVGAEFIKAPDTDPFQDIDKNELELIKRQDDKKVKIFSERFLDLSDIKDDVKPNISYQAFKQYYTVKEKNYLWSLFSDFSKHMDEMPDIDNIGEKVVIIPDIQVIRRNASDFGGKEKFDRKNYFNRLKTEARQGHIKILGDRIKKIIETAKPQDGDG